MYANIESNSLEATNIGYKNQLRVENYKLNSKSKSKPKFKKQEDEIIVVY